MNGPLVTRANAHAVICLDILDAADRPMLACEVRAAFPVTRPRISAVRAALIGLVLTGEVTSTRHPDDKRVFVYSTDAEEPTP